MHSLRVAVIGAGVVGLSVARSLALAGASVTVFERGTIGSGTTARSFAWVNSNGKQPRSYHELNVAGMAEHEELGTLSRCGSAEWARDDASLARLDARAHELIGLGYPAERLTADEFASREPGLVASAFGDAVWSFPTEGYVRPVELVARLAADARHAGASVRENTAVTSITETPTGVTLQLGDNEIWTGDRVVSATGRWTHDTVAMLGLDLAMIDADRPGREACGFLARTSALPGRVGSVLLSPDLNIRPDGDGRVLLQALDLDDQADPAHPVAGDGAIAQELLERLRRVIPDAADATIDEIVVGQRSKPADGLPAVGALSARTFVVAAHSGITLGPLLGRLVADELVTGVRSPLLADFSPGRLLRAAGMALPHESFPAAQ